MNKAFITLIILLLINGCGLLSFEYKKPEPPVPAEWNLKTENSNASLPKVNEIKWQDFVTDERLKKIIDAGLKNNKDLRLAALNVERTMALYGIQKAELYPAIGASGSYSKQREAADFSRTGKAPTTDRYGLNIGITSWEIDFFGRISSLKDAALEEFLATQEAKRSTTILLIATISEAYYTLAADRELLKIAKETLKTQEETLSIIKSRYNVGISTEIDLQRAQSQVENAKIDVAALSQQVSKDINALNLLAGETIPETLLPQDFSDISQPKEIAIETKSEVLLQRPDIISAEHRLKKIYANIKAARAAFFPRISLTTSIGTASNELSGLFGSGSGIFSFTPQISIPIFDSRIIAAYEATKVERDIAVANYEKTIQTAFKEVADVLTIRSTIGEELSATNAYLKALYETYKLANIRYEKGLDSYLSVLDAQRSLYLAKQRFVNINLLDIISKTRLYAVLGGGL